MAYRAAAQSQSAGVTVVLWARQLTSPSGRKAIQFSSRPFLFSPISLPFLAFSLFPWCTMGVLFLCFVAGVVAALAPVDGLRFQREPRSPALEAGHALAFLGVHSDLRFGEDYHEIKIDSQSDGSVVVRFTGKVGGQLSLPRDQESAPPTKEEPYEFVTELPNASSGDPETACFHRNNLGSSAPSLQEKAIDAGTPDVSLLACQTLCRNLDGCTHVTYNKNSKTCSLKTGMPKHVTRTGEMTAASSCDGTCFVKNIDYAGGELASYTRSTMVTECQSACASEPKCKVFVWNPDSRKCSLKGEGFSGSKQRHEGFIAGPQLTCTQGGSVADAEAADREWSVGSAEGEAEQRPDWEKPLTVLPNATGSNADTACFLRVNLASSAPNIETKTVDAGTPDESLTACQGLCRDLGGCTHVTYNKNSKTCFLKSGRPRHVRDSPGDMTAASSCDVSCFVENIDYTSGEIDNTTVSALVTTCQIACAAEPECKVFVWNPSDQRCSLKRQGFSLGKQRRDGFIAGPKVTCPQGGSLYRAEAADKE